MDSPNLQSLPHPQRLKASSTLAAQPTAYPTGIRKRSSSTHPSSASTLDADRLRSLVSEQSSIQSDSRPSTYSALSGLQWITPQHSPQPNFLPDSASLEPFPQWTAPTPPRSDSGVPSLSVDSSNDEVVSSGVVPSPTFGFEGATTSSGEMSSLGFLLPSQYGNGLYESESSNYNMDQSYIPSMRSQPSTLGPSGYSQTISSSPALYQSRPIQPSTRRQSDLAHGNGPDPSISAQRRISSPYDSTTNEYAMPSGQSIPSISGLTQSSLPSPYVSSTTSNPSAMTQQYNTGLSRYVEGPNARHDSILSSQRSPSLYDSTMYTPPMTTSPSATHLYASSQSMSYPPPFVGSSVNEVLAKPLGSDASIRVLNQRPKPQCWDHGCNGRQFSTFSNLLRHQREKSGTANKSYCPRCGAEFTRTTARNGHLAHDKCSKSQRTSDDKSI